MKHDVGSTGSFEEGAGAPSEASVSVVGSTVPLRWHHRALSATTLETSNPCTEDPLVGGGRAPESTATVAELGGLSVEFQQRPFWKDMLHFMVRA